MLHICYLVLHHHILIIFLAYITVANTAALPLSELVFTRRKFRIDNEVLGKQLCHVDYSNLHPSGDFNFHVYKDCM